MNNDIKENFRLFLGYATGIIIGPAFGFLAWFFIYEWFGFMWLGIAVGIFCQAVFALISSWITKD